MEDDIIVIHEAPLSYDTWSMGRCLYLCFPCKTEYCHSFAFWNHVQVTSYWLTARSHF